MRPSVFTLLNLKILHIVLFYFVIYATAVIEINDYNTFDRFITNIFSSYINIAISTQYTELH